MATEAAPAEQAGTLDSMLVICFSYSDLHAKKCSSFTFFLSAWSVAALAFAAINSCLRSCSADNWPSIAARCNACEVASLFSAVCHF